MGRPKKSRGFSVSKEGTVSSQRSQRARLLSTNSSFPTAVETATTWYNGGPDRLYNQFYAAIKNWGGYEIVSSPAEADLVLEVSLTNPFIGEYVSGGGQTSVSSHSMSDPQFRLVIVAPGTRVTLWVFTEHIEPAPLQGNRDKNFDQAVSFLFNDLRNVAGQPVPSANNKK